MGVGLTQIGLTCLGFALGRGSMPRTIRVWWGPTKGSTAGLNEANKDRARELSHKWRNDNREACRRRKKAYWEENKREFWLGGLKRCCVVVALLLQRETWTGT